MKNKKDAYFAAFLVVLAIGCIIIFLLVPSAKNRHNDEVSNSVTLVSDSVNSVSEQGQVADGESMDVSQSVDSTVDILNSNSAVSHSVEVTVNGDIEALKAQVPNIIKNGTLADVDLIFIGDSIFVFGDEENDSVPDKVARMSEIMVYGCSKPGMAAGTETNSWVDMIDLISCFTNGVNSDGDDTDLFNYSLNRYRERNHDGRQLIFILNCCINDYYQHTELNDGTDNPETFVGSYITSLAILKENYPDAAIICMVPNDIRHEEYGYNFNKVHSTYNMYKDAIQSVAEDFNVYCLRMDTENGINRDNLSGLLEDGTHPNGPGRELMAQTIINYVQAILDSAN